MSRIKPVAAALTVLLSACMTTPASTGSGPIPPSAATCNAGPAAWAVGKQASADVVEHVRVDSHSQIVRMLRPGQMITMEFNPQRVDIRVDGGKIILAVSCG